MLEMMAECWRARAPTCKGTPVNSYMVPHSSAVHEGGETHGSRLK